MNNKGFTLIELILAMVILSILSLYTWMSMDASFKTQRAIERFASLYEQASAISEKLSMDLSQMYLIPSSQNLTYLKGEEDKIAFTSLSHATLTATAKESEQTEITYKTESNQNRRGLNLLMRSETRFIDGPTEEKEDLRFETLTGQLESISFEYSKDGVDYVKSWDTTSRDYKDQLPKIIKLSVHFREGKNPDNPDRDREVFLQSYIDIPMSDFFTPAPTTTPQAGGNQPGQQDGQQNSNTPNANAQQNRPSNNIQPFGVDG